MIDLFIAMAAQAAWLVSATLIHRRQGREVKEAMSELKLHCAAGEPHILLVEDNPFASLLFQSMLQKMGARVSPASSGPQALEMLAQHHFDLVLMDIQLPGWNGFQTALEIRRSSKRFRTIPIIAVTADIEGDQRRRCLQSGMNDFYAKPVDERGLFFTISKWLPQPDSQANSAA